MAEYIEREALLNALSESTEPFNVASVFRTIKRQSKADVAPVRHGYWILVDKSYEEYECSVCHARDSDCSDYYGAHNVTDQDYCPHCGAKMDLEEEAK